MSIIRSNAARFALELAKDPQRRDALEQMSHTALRNLVRAAGAADCVEELEILVPYQKRRGVLAPAAADLVEQVILRAKSTDATAARQFVHYTLANLARLRPDAPRGGSGRSGGGAERAPWRGGNEGAGGAGHGGASGGGGSSGRPGGR